MAAHQARHAVLSRPFFEVVNLESMLSPPLAPRWSNVVGTLPSVRSNKSPLQTAVPGVVTVLEPAQLLMAQRSTLLPPQ